MKKIRELTTIVLTASLIGGIGQAIGNTGAGTGTGASTGTGTGTGTGVGTGTEMDTGSTTGTAAGSTSDTFGSGRTGTGMDTGNTIDGTIEGRRNRRDGIGNNQIRDAGDVTGTPNRTRTDRILEDRERRERMDTTDEGFINDENNTIYSE